MGLPGPITRQLRASGDIKTLDAAVTRARLLMTIDAEPVAIVEEKSSEVQLLTEQVALLTEQVAALSTRHQGNKQQGVEDSHAVSVVTKWDMYSAIALIVTRRLDVLPVGSQDISQETVSYRETNGGRLDRAAGVPFNKPNQ